MALVPKGNASGWFAGFTLMDTQGDTTRMNIELSSTTEAEAQATADLLYTQINILTECRIIGTTLRKEMEETDNSFPVGADVSSRAKCTVVLTGGQKKATLTIPSPVESLFTAPEGANNNIVDVTNGSLLNLLAVYGPVGPGNGALISDGETIDVVLRGRRTTVSRGINSV